MLQGTLAQSLGVTASITCAYNHKQSDGIRTLDVEARSIREERSSLLPNLHATLDFNPVAAVAVDLLVFRGAAFEKIHSDGSHGVEVDPPSCRICTRLSTSTPWLPSLWIFSNAAPRKTSVSSPRPMTFPGSALRIAALKVI